MNTNNKYLSYQQVSDLTAIKINTLYALVHNKKIPHTRFNTRLVRFSEKAILDWMQECSVAPTKEIKVI